MSPATDPTHSRPGGGIADRLDAAWKHRHEAVAPGVVPWITVPMLIAAAIGIALAGIDMPYAGFHTLNDLGRSLPAWLLASLTEIGNTAVLAALFAVFGRRHPQALLAFIVATLAGAIVINSLKDLLDVPRPPALLDTGEIRVVGEAYRHESLPSGHAFTTFAAAAVALGFIGSAWLRALVLALAVVVGSTRVMVGVHWPVDVCAGALGGLTTGGLAVLVSRYARFGYRPAGHLALVWLVLISNAVLFYNGSNYALAAPFARGLAVALTAVVALEYLRPRPRTG